MTPMIGNLPVSKSEPAVEKAYEVAKELYGALDVDVEKAVSVLATVPLSLHCWQGDDVNGFEPQEGATGGGIAVTGSYPGLATTIDQLRQDAEKVFSLLPGSHRFNLHAKYGDFGEKPVDRNAITTDQFRSWIDWAKEHTAGLDFNPTCFAHPKADSGFTLSHQDEGIRQFWVEHCIATREIAAEMGKELGSPCVNNIWIPDGMKDVPADRKAPRERLSDSLDKVLAQEFDKSHLLDAVESKLFGIGAESYTVGSHEFYFGYAVKNEILYCIDAGHFHPTESIADKLSSTLCHVDEVLMHISRGVRWDSDHVILLTDEVRSIAEEIVRGDYLNRVHIGLDFFDASINRIGAWTIGTRAVQKALLTALLQPVKLLKKVEREGDYTSRLALNEEMAMLPVGAVWDYFCLKKSVPSGTALINEIAAYEKTILSKR